LVSSVEPALALPENLPERLSLALESTDPARAIRAVLAERALPEATAQRVLDQALSVGRRAREREPRATACEVQLSLGVVLVLSGATSRGAEPVIS
jgi:hypothetical protein